MRMNEGSAEDGRPAVDRAGFWEQFTEVNSALRIADYLVFGLILCFGALQFFHSEKVRDFQYDDVFFADAGRSLVEHGFYGINGYAETNQPPGLPWVLGMLSLVGGCSHAGFLRAMAVFGTLGFLASYELLRTQAPRIVAAGICLLLVSSRIHFELVTQSVFPYAPYFFTSISLLLVARKLENEMPFACRLGWEAVAAVLMAASLMFASAGIAFIGGIVAIVCLVLFRDPHLAFARLRRGLAILLAGIAVQGFWMHHKAGSLELSNPGAARQTSQSVEASSGISAEEWPLPGFPQPYLSQLKVKSGNDPELGIAKLSDIPVRILKNAYQRYYLLAQAILHRSNYITWMSILVAGPLLLVVIGWLRSVWPSGGGLLEWYFAGYEFIYLLWPWSTEPRFFLPVAPLACLYVWRGIKMVIFLAKHKPRALGVAWFPLGVILTTGTWFWMHGATFASHLSHGGLQDEASCAFWLLTVLLSLWMVWADTAWVTTISALLRRGISVLRVNPRHLLSVSGLIVVSGLVLVGLIEQLRLGRANLDPASATNQLSPDALAGMWVRSHSDSNAVVMARHVPTVYHYSSRKLVWFPPSSNPKLLMEGIVKYKVDFLVVVGRNYSYYLPPDGDCFAPLVAAYPNAFRLVFQAPKLRIFSVSERPVRSGQHAGRLLITPGAPRSPGFAGETLIRKTENIAAVPAVSKPNG
jgi:hypothetical protein